MTVVCTVLKTGGDYHAEHVQAIHSQFGEHRSVCLTDAGFIEGVDTLPLKNKWAKWWSKMNLFDPNLIADDLLYFDIDTLVLGDISKYMDLKELTMLSDFYHPENAASGVMFIPQHIKSIVYDTFCANPEYWMTKFRGDQDFLHAMFDHIARFGDEVKSYKVHVASVGMAGYHNVRSLGNGKIPEGTDVLCFHGYPRPFQIDIKAIM